MLDGVKKTIGTRAKISSENHNINSCPAAIGFTVCSTSRDSLFFLEKGGCSVN